MKKIPVTVKISILVFLVIIILTFAFSRPIYNRIKEGVDKAAFQLTDKVTELTGLTLTYDSFSPSILSFLSIKGIKLADEKGSIILSIKNTRVNYKLSELIKGNMETFIRSVLVSGVDVDVGQIIGVVEKLSLANKNDKKNTPEIEEILSFVPQDVTVKNISLNYSNESFDSSFVIIIK